MTHRRLPAPGRRSLLLAACALVAGNVVAGAQSPPDPTRRETARADARDSMDTVSVAVPDWRPSRDSISLARTVAAGLRQRWPTPNGPVRAGAVLPHKRIVAFYGSTLSRRMGILGQYAPDTMLAKLDSVTSLWKAADPNKPVQPALHYVAVVASAQPGDDGRWRMRMDSATIERVYGWAQRAGAILFLDIQAGHSSVMEELPRLARFLRRPDVHLGIDPEFNMRTLRDSVAPGKQVGVLTAEEINFAISYLAELAEEHDLPPKVLVVHRFRQGMVRGARSIRLDPRVQVVMHMDGWGAPVSKYFSYRAYIVSEPVQFTGFKLFFRHDTQFGDRLLTPLELIQLRPAPLYIQYQ